MIVPVADTTMVNLLYNNKLKAAFHKLVVVSLKIDHFGRYNAATVLYMEEVDHIITRATRNWSIDIFR